MSFNRRFLVTGGAGFIGSHLAEALAARGDDVYILDDESTGSRENIAHLLDEDGKGREQVSRGAGEQVNARWLLPVTR